MDGFNIQEFRIDNMCGHNDRTSCIDEWHAVPLALWTLGAGVRQVGEIPKGNQKKEDVQSGQFNLPKDVHNSMLMNAASGLKIERSKTTI